VVVRMNDIGIAWDMVEFEMNLLFGHERKQGESNFLSNHSPLGNMLPPQSSALGTLLSW
jgi:hypothetical protein